MGTTTSTTTKTTTGRQSLAGSSSIQHNYFIGNPSLDLPDDSQRQHRGRQKRRQAIPR